MFTAVLGTAGASKSTTVISNYYLLGHKLMSLSIIGPIFPIPLPFQHCRIHQTSSSIHINSTLNTYLKVEVLPMPFSLSYLIDICDLCL